MGVTIFFNLIFFLTITQVVEPNPYKYNNEIQLKHFNRHAYKQNHKVITESPHKKHFKEDPSDLSSESRRLFDWIKKILNKNDTKTTPKTPSYEDVISERIRFRQIEKNLTETLTKLSHVLNQILNIVKYARYSHFEDLHELLPTRVRNTEVNRRDNRRKRDLNKNKDIYQENTNNKDLTKIPVAIYTNSVNANYISPDNQSKIDLNTLNHDGNENITIRNSNVTVFNNLYTINDKENIKTPVNLSRDLNVYVPAKIGRLSLNIQETRVKRETTETKKGVNKTLKVDVKTEVNNKNSSTPVKIKDATTEEVITNGRRAMVSIKVTNNEVKNRLFQYIDEAFADIVKKIDSLKQTKEIFGKDVSYNIGYIISNIDTLEVNMRNMKRDMDKNKYIWDDKKILNLYDTVKVSNQAVADLLQILKNYMEKSF